MLFSVTMGGREAYLHVLFEHQSTVDAWMPLRLLVYVTQIWTALRDAGAERLPIVIPVVLHHGESGWTAATTLGELLDADEELLAVARPFIPDFAMIVDDLTRVPELELIQRTMTSLARLVVYVLPAVRVGFDPSMVTRWAREADAAGVLGGAEAVARIFRYLSDVDGGAGLHEALLEALESEELREDVMTLRKEWEDKGTRRGTRRRARRAPLEAPAPQVRSAPSRRRRARRGRIHRRARPLGRARAHGGDARRRPLLSAAIGAALRDPRGRVGDAVLERREGARGVEAVLDPLVVRVAEAHRPARLHGLADHHGHPLHAAEGHEDRAGAVLVEVVPRGVDADAAEVGHEDARVHGIGARQRGRREAEGVEAVEEPHAELDERSGQARHEVRLLVRGGGLAAAAALDAGADSLREVVEALVRIDRRLEDRERRGGVEARLHREGEGHLGPLPVPPACHVAVQAWVLVERPRDGEEREREERRTARLEPRERPLHVDDLLEEHDRLVLAAHEEGHDGAVAVEALHAPVRTASPEHRLDDRAPAPSGTMPLGASGGVD
ncbi:MAG: Rpn family recombination-promoting nuclease/putative transposase [Sandaracinaceae bacterium]|nr:Rpn family recombination-promoting nuclease/putative transposase [Sandaracinaceae bacterium]